MLSFSHHINMLPRLIRIAALGSIALYLSACSQTQTPQLRLGTNVWPGYEPLYLAQSQGNWESSEIRLVTHPSASEVIRSFRNKSLEAAALTLDEALLLLESGHAIQIFLVTDFSEGADVIMARPGIRHINELRGRQIAVEGNALGAYVLTRALEIHGMKVNEVIVNHLNVNSHENAYLRNEVDAVVTFEPVRTKLLNAGAHEIFTSREIPGEIIDVLVVHEELTKTHKKNLQKVVNGWFKALQFMEQEPEKAADISAKRLHISLDQVIDSYASIKLPSREENISLLGSTENNLIATANRLQATMLSERLLKRPVSTMHLLTDQFVR